jgi:DNA-binding HxlR family transcriptional regulator
MTKNKKAMSIYDCKCPIIRTLEIIGGKWKMPILWSLSENGSVRYNELRRSVHGITNMMLTKCLKDLEKSGLISRKQFDEIPPHVEYSLTVRGAELLPAMHNLYKWGEEQINIEEELLKDNSD